MGKRGPKRLPTTLKIIRGTARGKDKRRREPQPPVTRLRCPRDFPDEARQAFRRLSRVLVPLGLLTAADTESFEMMCLHYGLARRAALEMWKDGLTAPDDNGIQRKSPLNQLVREHSAEYRRYAALFGLSPSARAEIDLPQMSRSRRQLLLQADENGRFFGDTDGWNELAGNTSPWNGIIRR